MKQGFAYETKTDVVPIINVSLVVVLTLMIISPFLDNSEHPVDLPDAQASEVEDTDNIEITYQLDIRMIVLVNLRRKKIRMNDGFIPRGVPQAGMVFHPIVAPGNHDICRIHRTGHKVLGLQPDCVQTIFRVHVHASLGHEGTDHSDPRGLTEQSQLLTCSPANTTVSSQDNGPLGIL